MPLSAGGGQERTINLHVFSFIPQRVPKQLLEFIAARELEAGSYYHELVLTARVRALVETERHCSILLPWPVQGEAQG